MATKGFILDRVADLLEDTSSTTRSRLSPWVSFVLSEMKLDGLLGPLAASTLTTTPGTDTYTLPADVEVLHRLAIRDRDVTLLRITPEEFVAQLAASSTLRGLPTKWTLWREPTEKAPGLVRVWPVPDAAYTIDLTYDADFSALTADTNVLELTDALATTVVWGVYRIATRIEESPDVEAATQEFRLHLARAKARAALAEPRRVKPDIP